VIVGRHAGGPGQRAGRTMKARSVDVHR
jgi:hypothetical protein